MSSLVAIAVLLTSLAGIVTSVAILWVKVGRPFMKFCKRVYALVDTMQDLPEWCDSVEESLSELRPNGGSSLKDEVSQVKELLEKHLKDHP